MRIVMTTPIEPTPEELDAAHDQIAEKMREARDEVPPERRRWRWPWPLPRE